ncbi:hypothetical protein [Bdellovibrio bacteriovorus]|uniref:hypothetical protein n=1 Tax=Bdellovibrio TaxID=958 RepID=UPI0035A92567
MGKPLMIQLDDDKRIEELKKKTGAKTKIDVVRAALTLLEHDVKRTEKIQRWQRAAMIVGRSGLDVLKDFQTKDRFKKLP